MEEEKKLILVTGSNGQLGKELQRLCVLYEQYDFIFASRDFLPIDNYKSLKKLFTEHQIDYCINCAAYTAVDKAESEKELAFRINGEAVGNLASLCRDHQCKLIHISTDYVFNGESDLPYKEDHSIDPQNVYGASKLRGEELVLNNLPGAIIIRTSWVFSSFGSNFVKTMLKLMSEKENLNVVDDQIGSPTYAADLAEVIMKIIGEGENLSGIYNYCNAGIISWYGFAKYIKGKIKSNCFVHPIPTSNFPTPAKRPRYSSLDTSKIKGALKLNIPTWKNAVDRCLSVLG
ncbi:MAG: dTDP-4-dehydrorhamnose reductase [Ginsengibacter sp.]